MQGEARRIKAEAELAQQDAQQQQVATDGGVADGHSWLCYLSTLIKMVWVDLKRRHFAMQLLDVHPHPLSPQAAQEARVSRVKEAEARALTAERELAAKLSEAASAASAAHEREERAKRFESLLFERERQVGPVSDWLGGCAYRFTSFDLPSQPQLTPQGHQSIYSYHRLAFSPHDLPLSLRNHRRPRPLNWPKLGCSTKPR